jgi:hypothetical protein
MAVLNQLPSAARAAALLRLAVAIALVWTVGLFTARAAAPAPPSSEAEVKADYLFLFSKYVEWPAGVFAATNQPLVVAVLGDEPLAAALERRVQGRITQGGRKLTVTRARRAADLGDCHMVFIPQSERRNLTEIASALGDRPVLSICDHDGLFAQGVMIKFVLTEGRVRFEVKLEPVERAGLSIHSGMLDSARRVWQKPQASLPLR